MTATDHTHGADVVSWVDGAGHRDADFPVQNLPFGAFRDPDSAGAPRLGVAIGTAIFDLARAREAGLLRALAAPVQEALAAPTLNALMALGREAARSVRHRVFALLSGSAPREAGAASCLVPMDRAALVLPVAVGDYTDFYASVHHATNVGSMFRPDNPLLPNYKHIPIGYHGRASSVVVSGTPIRRPHGQTESGGSPAFGPTRALDYECEVGAFIGPGNPLGTPVPIDRAGDQVFGLCLVNDWSARDIQRWEYQPLGPFLSKSFATTVSPWVVTMDALAPYRVPAAARADGDPAPLPYLTSDADQKAGAVELTLEVALSTASMRQAGHPPVRLSRSRFDTLYWTMAQLVAHHASNGCNLRPGDLLASGTVSGPSRDSRGCLLELTWRGSEPIELPTGELRRFLEDGDEVVMTGYCERPGFARIGFGACRGLIEAE